MNNNDSSSKLIRFKELIDQHNNIAIVFNKSANSDSFSAGCGLYESLKVLDKKVSIIYAGNIPEGCEDTIEKSAILKNVAERELHVSIDYSQTPAARVHYSTENDVLHLKVKPIDKNFNLDRVTSKIIGFNFDLVIALGIRDLEDIGNVYTELKDSFLMSKIINISNSELSNNFGSVNLIDNKKDSLCNLALQILSKTDLPVTNKVAQCFLKGITLS